MTRAPDKIETVEELDQQYWCWFNLFPASKGMERVFELAKEALLAKTKG